VCLILVFINKAIKDRPQRAVGWTRKETRALYSGVNFKIPEKFEFEDVFIMEYIAVLTRLILLTSVILQVGCGSSNSNETLTRGSNDLESTNLSGTWSVLVETRTINKNSNEYLNSSYIEYDYVIEESDNIIGYDRCWEYGTDILDLAVKSNDLLYLNQSQPGFVLLENGDLEQTRLYESEFQPDVRFESITTLSKRSAEIELDNGTLVLRGPISKSEYQHVCLFQSHNNYEDYRVFEVITPFSDNSLSVRLVLDGDVNEGLYKYTNYGDVEEIEINVISNTAEFIDQAGANSLVPKNVSITVNEFTEEAFSGAFSFTGLDHEQYSGEFEILF